MFADGLKGRLIRGVRLAFAQDTAQPLHFSLILPRVPQHRFDVRQQIESVDLQQVVLLFTWSVCLSHVVAMVLRQPKFRTKANRRERWKDSCC
jgi:hypothetical protein